MSGERDGLMIDGIGLRCLSGWVSRSFHAIVADLGLVESGSLDVLLYCADDVAASTTGGARLTEPADRL
jgi:hypothetical protein